MRNECLHSLDVVWVSDCPYRILQTRETPIASAAAIPRTLVPESSAVVLNIRISRKFAGTDFWANVDKEFLLI